MADGDLKLTIPLALLGVGAPVKIGSATTGTVAAGPTTGTVR